MDGENSPISTG